MLGFAVIGLSSNTLAQTQNQSSPPQQPTDPLTPPPRIDFRIPLAPLPASSNPAEILRTFIAAGLGQQAASELPAVPVQAARVPQNTPPQTPAANVPKNAVAADLASATLEQALAKLNADQPLPALPAESTTEPANKLRSALASGERLLKAGSVQQAYRLLDDVAARAREAQLVLHRSERLVAEAAMRATREAAAREACLRAARAAVLPPEDASAMLWLAAGEATLDAPARLTLLAQAYSAATKPAGENANPQAAAQLALRTAIEIELSKALAEAGAVSAATALEASARSRAARLPSDDLLAEQWFGQPLALALSSVRATQEASTAKLADVAMLQGESRQALALYEAQLAAAEKGSADAWAARVRVLAAQMSLGDVEAACNGLLDELLLQRSQGAERAALVARAIVLCSAELDAPRASQVSDVLARRSEARGYALEAQLRRALSQPAQQPVEAAPAQPDQQVASSPLALWRLLQLRMITPGCISAEPPAQAARNGSVFQRVMLAKSTTSETGSGWKVPLVQPTSQLVLGLPTARTWLELARAQGLDVAATGDTLCQLADTNSFHEVARLFIAHAGEAAAREWATASDAEFSPQALDQRASQPGNQLAEMMQQAAQSKRRAFRACVLLRLGMASEANELLVQHGKVQELLQTGRFDGDTAFIMQTWLRCLLRLEKFDDAVKLVEALQRSISRSVLLPLMGDGWFPILLAEGSYSDLSEAPNFYHAPWIASVKPETDKAAQAQRRDALQKLRVPTASLPTELLRFDQLLFLSQGPPENETTRQALAIVQRELPFAPLPQRIPKDGEASTSAIEAQKLALVKQRKFAEALAFATPRYNLARAGAPISALTSSEPTPAQLAAFDDLISACDPRVIVSLPPEQIAAASELTLFALFVKTPNLCHKAIAVQLLALKGESIDKIVSYCTMPERGADRPSVQLLFAADEALAMQGNTAARLDLMSIAAMQASPEASSFVVETLVRYASWGTMQDALALLEKLGNGPKLQAFVRAVNFGEDVPAKLSQRKAQVLYEIGAIAHREMRDQFAMDLYLEALRIDPAHAWTANNLAYLILERGGDINEAERLLEIAIKQFPGRASIADSVGYLRYKQGRLKNFTRNGEEVGGAMQWLKYSFQQLQLEDRGGNVEITLHLADAHWQLSREQDAEAAQPNAAQPNGKQLAAASRAEAQRLWAMSHAAALEQVQFGQFMQERDPGRYTAAVETARQQLAGLQARMRYAEAFSKGAAANLPDPVEPITLSPVFTPRKEPTRTDTKPLRLAPDGDPCARFAAPDPDEFFEP